jgi:DNA-binding response OmpR family regulator
MRVLLIEDDVELADAVRRGLVDSGFAVDVAVDGDAGLAKARVTAYDVILLDRDLPALHGDDVCRRLIEAGNPARILMLTAAGELSDRVDGLSLGADDYLSKPFALVEVVARIRALVRRNAGSPTPVLAHGDLLLDTTKRNVRRGEQELRLTRKEFGVLEQLMLEPGAVVSAEQLLEKVWDEHADPFTNAIRITMQTLRRKLGEPSVIETVIGVGYRMIA